MPSLPDLLLVDFNLNNEAHTMSSDINTNESRLFQSVSEIRLIYT